MITNIVTFFFRCIIGDHCLQVQCHTVHKWCVWPGTCIGLFSASDVGPWGCVDLWHHNFVPLEPCLCWGDLRKARTTLVSGHRMDTTGYNWSIGSHYQHSRCERGCGIVIVHTTSIKGTPRIATLNIFGSWLIAAPINNLPTDCHSHGRISVSILQPRS
jgi:hypothetical protein